MPGPGDMGSDPGFGDGTSANPFPQECNTGNDTIDSSDDAFSEIWEDSNPYAENLEDRQEQGLMLFPLDDGTYESLRFGIDIGAQLGPCSISDTNFQEAGFGLPFQWPPGVIIIHTHPIPPGVSSTDACPERIPAGVIENGPSDGDRTELRTLDAMGAEGVKGVIIDHDQVIEYTGTFDGSEDSVHARCGY
ncbi:MAG: hypothetical protein RQ741_14505 [Wenzhouxiangellaceae bacterium]|nr:hypothetical protein [Wenzhouxiangellaceae bacterium]